MIVLLVLILAALLVLGVRMTRFAFARRPVPDATDPEVVRHSPWVQYEPHISQSVAWLKTQPVQELTVVSYDGLRLHGRFVPAENAKATILQFHGYRSHYAVDFSASMQYYHDRGYNLLLVDQRAHGESEGRWITFGIKERFDVLSWVTYLTLMLGEEHPLLLSGVSMGATTVCMAADLELPPNVVGIVADCGFTSPADILSIMAKKQYHAPGWLAVGFLNIFSHLLCGFGLRDSSTPEALAHTSIPVALFHGLDDPLVPPRMSRQAYEACASKKRLTEFPGAGHGTSWLTDTPRYQAVLEEFLEECLHAS